MQIRDFFLSPYDVPLLIAGHYDQSLVLLSVFVATLAGVMAFQLAGMARTESRSNYRRIFLLSGAFVLGAGVWSMHFIGMLAYSVCSNVPYDSAMTLASMMPSFLASWIALTLLSKERISTLELVVSGVCVGAGIGLMHYSGMAAVFRSLTFKFDAALFAVSIVVAVGLSTLALWIRFRLSERTQLSARNVNILSGFILGIAISGMHYTGMSATSFLDSADSAYTPVSNFNLAISIAGISSLAIFITVGFSLLLRFRSLYQLMAHTEARTRTIMETAIDGIVTVDSQGVIRDFNVAAEAIFGWSKTEMQGVGVDVLVPATNRGQREGFLQNYFKEGSSQDSNTGQEILGLRRNGETFPMRLAIGRASHLGEALFVGFITDISERKQMETALRKSEQQHRSLIANLPGVAFRCFHNANRTMLFVSEAIERLTGWKAAEFTTSQRSLAGVIHPEDRSNVAESIKNALTNGYHYSVEYRILDKNNVEHWVSESASATKTAEGEVEWVDGVIIDITENKRRNAEFEGVVDAIGRSLAVIEFDLQGMILNANATFLAITGYQFSELQGQHHSILCAPEEVLSTAYEQFWETLRLGKHTAGDFHRIGKSGKEIWIHGSYNPILDPEGKPYKVVKFASDLSGRHRMEQDLREAKIRAEQAAEAKSSFLANMSHEIRTPMNAVIGFTDVLLDGDVNDSQRRHLTTVRNAARSLLTLLNDILDTAKLERGAVELEVTDFSLREVCMQVLATLRVNAQAKRLPLELEYANEAPEFFKGDALRLQQILLNLVGNAIKFTEEGRVSLQVRMDAGRVHLVVKDTGIGIPQDRIAKIFDPFSQADASMSRRFGGTGLGTTIARQLIELMNGRIWVESILGVGSQFHVELPLAPGDETHVSQDNAVIELPPLNILAADDVPQNLELLQILLPRYGHSLTCAANGREAVDLFIQGRFDVVLMDVQMPVLNGLEACRQIRHWEQSIQRTPTPIIAFSASVLQEDIREAQEAGMSGFATKPIDLYRLTQEIARLLGITSENTSPLASVKRLLLSGSVVDWHKGQQLWGSESRHQEAIRRFLGDFGDSVNRFRSLLESPIELAAQAHRLKGAAANLALMRVANLGGQIESLLASPNHTALPKLIEQLADELSNVTEVLVPLMPLSAPGLELSTKLDAAQLKPMLLAVDMALARGEFAEEALQELRQNLPREIFRSLDDAIQSFDFDTARQLVANQLALVD